MQFLILFLDMLMAEPLLPASSIPFSMLNTSTLRAKPLPFDPLLRTNMTWSQSSTCCGYGIFTPEAVSLASKTYGLFDVPCQWLSMPIVAEWGYEFHHNEQGIFPICGNLTMAKYATPPSDRDEALRRLALYWTCRAADARAAVNASSSAPIFSMTGHYFYSGLAAAFEQGRIIPGSEIGENINSINAHLSFTRGSSRQWGVPFIIDFSAWMQAYILDYSTTKFWGNSSSPIGGHSLSLFRRAYFASFFAGTNGLLAEAGAVNFFYENMTSGVLTLSPLGQIGQEIYALSHNTNVDVGETHPQQGASIGPEDIRGIPYVPIALVIEQGHGMGIGWWYQQEAWDVFPLSSAELQTSEWLSQLWPNSFQVMSAPPSASEANYMVASPFGEIVDVLLPQNLSAAILSEAYRVVVIAGLGQAIDSLLADELRTYVQNGGVVILNANESQAFDKDFLGLSLGGSNLHEVVSVVDVQVGWTAKSEGVMPVCVKAASNSYFLKIGGDPSKLTGWDGGISDKCCSQDGANCRWFGSSDECQAILPHIAAACRSCQSLWTNPKIGCPSWSNFSTPVNLFQANLLSATPLFKMTLANQTEVLSATLNTFGKGRVALLLNSGSFPNSERGFGITRHLLSRLRDELSPILLQSNVSDDFGGGVDVLMNRLPASWICSIFNNHGVVKQPASKVSIDWSQGRKVTLMLRPGMGTLLSAWQKDGARPRNPLQITNQSVTVEVEAGGLRIVGFELG